MRVDSGDKGSLMWVPFEREASSLDGLAIPKNKTITQSQSLNKLASHNWATGLEAH